MGLDKANFSARIHFVIGVKRSAAITKIEEHWLISIDEDCDVVENDLMDEGAAAVLECMGLDLDVEGSFVVDVIGIAKQDESPDYELTTTD